MEYNVLIQPQAENDLENIYNYLADFSVIIEDKWQKKIFSQMSSLSVMPYRYAVYPNVEFVKIELRQIVLGSKSACYRIIYAVIEKDKEVRIITIRHAARKPINIEDFEL